MQTLLQLGYAVFLAFWRRIFGGLFHNTPIISNRFLHHVIGALALAGFLYLSDYHLVQIILAPIVFQGLFWSRSHECCFDLGHREGTDVKEYEKLWYWNDLKKYIPEKYWYTFDGDFVLMTVRYTIPAILMAIILLNPLFIFAGLLVASIYTLCWIAYDFGWIKENPTEYAEVLTGFGIGLMI